MHTYTHTKGPSRVIWGPAAAAALFVWEATAGKELCLTSRTYLSHCSDLSVSLLRPAYLSVWFWINGNVWDSFLWGFFSQHLNFWPQLCVLESDAVNMCAAPQGWGGGWCWPACGCWWSWSSWMPRPGTDLATRMKHGRGRGSRPDRVGICILQEHSNTLGNVAVCCLNQELHITLISKTGRALPWLESYFQPVRSKLKKICPKLSHTIHCTCLLY